MTIYPGDAEGRGLRTWVSRRGLVGLGMRDTEGLAVRLADAFEQLKEKRSLKPTIVVRRISDEH